MIEYGCSGCGQRIHVGDEHAGKQAKCPKCGLVSTIPYGGPNMQPAMMPPGAAVDASYKGQAIAALVLGIASVVMPFVGAVIAIVGIVFGILALQKKRAGKGLAIAGIILSGLGMLIWPTVLVVAIMVPAMSITRQKARQQACQVSLSAVGKGVVMYSALSSDMFPGPMIKQYGDPNAPIRPGQTINTDFSRGGWSALGDNGMQNVWLLMKENLASTDHFRCPADAGWIKRSAGGYGWTDAREFSFGIHWPYDGLNSRSTNPAKLSDSNLDPGLVIFSDRNPRTVGNRSPQPSNHPQEGEVVLRRDSTVSFYRNVRDFNAGLKGDDIYSNSAGTPGGIPQNAGDTSITPMPSR